MFRKLLRLLCRHKYRYRGYKLLSYKGDKPIVHAIWWCEKCGHINKVKVKGKCEEVKYGR